MGLARLYRNAPREGVRGQGGIKSALGVSGEQGLSSPFISKSLLDNLLAFITMIIKNLGGPVMNNRASTIKSLNALFSEAFFGFYFITRPIVHGGALRV